MTVSGALTARPRPAAAAGPPGRRAGASALAARSASSSATLERRRAEPVGEVVDDADRRVGEAELAGDDALGGDRHPDQVGVGGDQPDLGRRLEARPDRLPVDAAVAQRAGAARRPGGEDFARASAGRSRARCGRGRRRRWRAPRCRAMKSSGQTKAADRRARLQRADRADRQHPVAALLGQRPQVGARGRSGGAGRRSVAPPWRCTIAAPCSVAAAAISRARGPERVAAEDHRRARPIGRDPTAGRVVASISWSDDGDARRDVTRARTNASTATSASCCRSCASRCPASRSSSPSCSPSRSSRTSPRSPPSRRRSTSRPCSAPRSRRCC